MKSCKVAFCVFFILYLEETLLRSHECFWLKVSSYSTKDCSSLKPLLLSVFLLLILAAPLSKPFRESLRASSAAALGSDVAALEKTKQNKAKNNCWLVLMNNTQNKGEPPTNVPQAD